MGDQGQDASSAVPYWVRPSLDVGPEGLRVAGWSAAELAERHGTPVFVVDLQRIGEQVRSLQSALTEAGLPHRVRLALKAQREPEVLRYLRGLGAPGDPGAVGMDACSPGEVELALAAGWSPREISCTGTNLSDEDLDVVLRTPVHINVDLLSQLDRLGRRAPGRSMGLRVNPRSGAAWGGGATLYSGAHPTKFGIYEEELDEAVALVRRHGLRLTTVHFHVADGFLNDGLGGVEEAVRVAARMTNRLLEAGCPVREVNTGGGLGVPLTGDDAPLDLSAWAEIMRHHLGPLGVTVGTEPGNFLVKESAVLLARVVSVEDRLGTRFVGLNVGWNVMSYRFLYGKPFEVVLCREPLGATAGGATVAGHINEGDDLFAEDLPLPDVVEDDIVAILAVGGYNQAMQSSHCLRPPVRTVCLGERLL